MRFFRIVIPNYNNAQWIEKSIGSVLEQTFTDYGLVVVDDCSDDGSCEKAIEMVGDRGIVVPLYKKYFNGGARNWGLNHYAGSKYTLFLDSDDWFISEETLQKLHDFIVEKNYPQCIRLSYLMSYEGDKKSEIIFDEDSPEKLVSSCFVACWTKCVRSDLVPEFAENTLMEDVVHHIKQCDMIDEVVPYKEPVVVYNRNNKNSCSIPENQDCQRGKWQSSMYRYMADLLDLELEHEYCIKHRDWRAEVCLNNIKDGKYIQ